MVNSYFYVPCQARLQSEPLPKGVDLPPPETLAVSPHPMSVLCGPLEPLDRSSVNALHKYGREFARLADRQVQTAVRINTLISYLIDVGTSDLKLTTTMIGGSGFRFPCPDPALATEGTMQRFTLAHPPLQIFVTGYARTVSVIPGENGSLPLVTSEFVLIREQDREAIIHAATLIQQEELRHRAEERAEERLTGTRSASTTSAFASGTATPSTSMSASPSATSATAAIPTETAARTVSTHTPKTSPIPSSPEESSSAAAPGSSSISSSSSRDITISSSSPCPGDVAGSCPSPGVLTGSCSRSEVVTGSGHGTEAISRTEARAETTPRSPAKPEINPGSVPKPVSETDPGSEAKPITVTGSPSSTGTDPATASATSHGETRP